MNKIKIAGIKNLSYAEQVYVFESLLKHANIERKAQGRPPLTEVHIQELAEKYGLRGAKAANDNELEQSSNP